MELADVVKERDSQMTALAKVLAQQAQAPAPVAPTQGANNEGELDAARAEVAQLTARCTQLRQMNEELLAMLEKMYAQEQK